jgi:hypothetical protein
MIPPLITAMIGMRVIDEMLKALEEEDDGRTEGCVETHKELR